MTRPGLLAAATILTLAAAPAAELYRVLQRFEVSGSVRWGYVAFDPGSRRLFVTREHSVDAIDAANGRVLGSVAGLGGAHGVAFDPGLRHGFATDGKAGSVVVFDTATMALTASVPMGREPDAVVFDDASGTVFAVERDSHDVVPISAGDLRKLPAIALPDEPEFAVADGAGHVFVNLTNRAEVAMIDTVARTLTRTWSLGPGCRGANGLAIDRAHRVLFATCRNGTMRILSAEDGDAIAAVAIGKGSDAAAFDPVTRTAFSSNGDGTLSVVAQDASGTYALRETVQTSPGARTMALDPQTHRLYLPSGVVDHVDPPDATRPYPRR